jgi:predicted SAM-dependent methyltransferase
MEYKKQVDKSHYEFSTYVTRSRWNSIWYQLNELLQLNPSNVLEVGPGPGLFKVIGSFIGLNIDTLDIDSEITPDYVGSATQIPFEDSTYDVVCSFQMLEHLPYERSLQAFREFVRVSKKYIVISLPDSKITLRYQFYIPLLGDIDFRIPHIFKKPFKHEFNGEHYWEINKKDYLLAKVVSDLSVHAKMTKSFRVYDSPYYRFFIFEKLEV